MTRREPCPSCGAFTMRGSRGVDEDFRVCAHPCHGPLSEPYASNGRTFLDVTAAPAEPMTSRNDPDTYGMGV